VNKKFKLIKKDELDAMLAAGTARKFPGMPIYEQLETPAVAAPVPPKQPDQPAPGPEDDENAPTQDYATREMRSSRAALRRTTRKTS
jgi:hypothetical protein